MSKTFTLHIQDLRQECHVHSLNVRWHLKISDVKDLLHGTTGVPPARQQLFQNNCPIPLSSSLTLHCLNIDRSGYTLRLSIIDANTIGDAEFILNHAQEITLDDECTNILADIRLGLRRENMPIKTDVLDCTGGVYFMRALCGRKVAVFKPFDEEQGMPNNTKGYRGTGQLGLRQHTKPGYGCLREVAAYMMDVNNFCRVPPTMLVHCEHPILNYQDRFGIKSHPYPKLGSLQKFIHAFDTFEDVGCSLLSDLEVQKVALLDLRILNGDRNASNILAMKRGGPSQLSCQCSNTCKLAKSPGNLSVKGSCDGSLEGEYELVPIDHGYCLPSRLLIHELDWAWYYYPQVSRPVHVDIKEYLANLDLESILKSMLSQVALSDESIFLAKISHKLVVEGVAAGLTLFDIASIVARVTDDVPSTLERVIEEAEENAHRTIEMRAAALTRSTRGSSVRGSGDRSAPQSSRQRSSSLQMEEAPKYTGETSSQEPFLASEVGTRCHSKFRRRSLLETHSQSSPEQHDTKSVRFMFNNSHSRIDEVTGCTDSSGTNTPSIKGGSGPGSPDRDQIFDMKDYKAMSTSNHISSDEEDTFKITNVKSDPEQITTSSPAKRLSFVDADKALECRIGSPISLEKCPPHIFPFSSISAEENCCTTSTLTQPSGRMRRVNTSNHVTLSVLEGRAESSTSDPLYDKKHGAASKMRAESFDDNERLIVPLPFRRQSSSRDSDFNTRGPRSVHLSTLSADSSHATSKSTTSYDGEDMYYDDDDTYTTDVDGSPLSSPSSPLAHTSDLYFLRVTSFSAFSSAPIYDSEGAERRLGNLQKERRRQIALTAEFARIRLLFAQNSVDTLISKALRSKARLYGSAVSVPV
jgi:Phosphatidylinositol 3- and 4-kinase